MLRHISRIIGAVVAVSLAGMTTCGEDAADKLVHTAPGLPPELAHQLTHSDDEALAAFGGEYGFYNLNSVWKLVPPYDVSTDDEATALDRVINPAMARVPLLYSAFPIRVHISDWVRNWEAASPGEKREVARLTDELVSVKDMAPDGPEKEAALRRMIDAYQEHPQLLDSGQAYSAYIHLLIANDRRGEVGPLLERAIDEAIETGHHASACYLLGLQGIFRLQQGGTQDVLASYYRGLDIARHCLPAEEARLLSFIGTYYRHHGRFTMTYELYHAAEDAAARPGEEGNEIRYFVESLQLLADLGYWDMIGSEFQRLDVLERRAHRYIGSETDAWLRRVALLRVRYYAAIGDLDRAERELDDVRDRLGKDPPRDELERILTVRSDILIDAGHHAEARAIVAEGIARCKATSLTERLHHFYLDRARIEYLEGDHDACRMTLDEFDRLSEVVSPAESATIARDVLRARLALADNDPALYSRWTSDALERAAMLQEQMETVPQHLLSGGVSGLQDLLREQVSDDPISAVALELYWQRSTELSAGSRQQSDTRNPLMICGDVVGAGEDRTWRLNMSQYMQRLKTLGATHLVYAVTRDDVIRWTLHDETVVRDTLGVALPRLMELVGHAREELLAKGRGPSLRELGDLLVPTQLRGKPATDHPLLLISADGPLADLPFEALPLPEAGDGPLLTGWDVAYVRGIPDEAKVNNGGKRLIITDPVVAPILGRQYPGLRERLEYSRHEAGHLAALDPDAILLTGEQATEEAVLAVWTGARAIYFATHAMRDSRLPYLSFIPVSLEPDDNRHESFFIDASDIRDANLSRCDLVVLSGCATGSGYHDHHVRAPALSDAFLDAGCGAVIYTFWNIEDQPASEIMRDFNDAWAGEGTAPIRALNEVRRRRFEAGAPASVWAAYAIVLGRL